MCREHLDRLCITYRRLASWPHDFGAARFTSRSSKPPGCLVCLGLLAVDSKTYWTVRYAINWLRLGLRAPDVVPSHVESVVVDLTSLLRIRALCPGSLAHCVQ